MRGSVGANEDSWEEKVYTSYKDRTRECQDALCGEPLGSQQTLLMGCVLDYHPLPLKLGTPAAPGHPAMPRVLSCWGSLGCFPSGASSRLRGTPPAEQSISSPGAPLASQRAPCRTDPLRLQVKAAGCAGRSGPRVNSRSDADSIHPRGSWAGCVG